VPVGSFPRRIEVLDAQGRVAHTVAKLPLVEGLPTGNDAVPTGPRMVSWRADAPATLVWAEAQDGGDPARDAAIRDAVLVQAAPFDRPPVTLARLAARYAGITWGRGDVALLSEYWWKTRQVREWKIAPDQPATTAMPTRASRCCSPTTAAARACSSPPMAAATIASATVPRRRATARSWTASTWTAARPNACSIRRRRTTRRRWR